MYPAQHGILEGVRHRHDQATSLCDCYRGAYPTLAERFRAGGWRCAAFVHNAQLGPFSGLDAGFDEYWCDKGEADAMLSALERWLGAEPGRPAFVYLHFLEVHWPYRPRRRHVRLFGGDRDANRFYPLTGPDFGKLRRQIERGTTSLAAGDVEQIVQLYDAMIRRLDDQLVELEALLARAGRAERTALVVTADHGDEFYDHGRIGHGHSLYEELTHVPLFARLPDGPGGVRIAEPVSLVDVPATLLRLGAVDDSGTSAGLLGPGCVPRPVVSELRTKRSYRQTIQSGAWKLHRRFRFSDQERVDVRQHSPAELRAAAQAKYELYDLTADPQERTDRSRDPWAAERLAALEQELDRWWDHAAATRVVSAGQAVEVDERVVARLRDLGYLE